MADKSTQLILDALSRAVAEPGGVPLHGNKKAPGLFASTATAKQLALRCKEEGLLRVLHAENGSKTTQEICALTEKGLTYLLDEVSPKQVLEDLVRALEARHAHVGELVAAARRWQEGLDALQATVQRVLDQLQKPGKLVAGAAPSANGSERWLAAVMAYLAEWQRADKTSDCPLPDLYRVARQTSPHLTIGHFHDGLRRLHEQEKIYLHPWTGPLYEIPEPPYALLIGHEIVYYVSEKGTGPLDSFQGREDMK